MIRLSKKIRLTLNLVSIMSLGFIASTYSMQSNNIKILENLGNSINYGNAKIAIETIKKLASSFKLPQSEATEQAIQEMIDIIQTKKMPKVNEITPAIKKFIEASINTSLMQYVKNQTQNTTITHQDIDEYASSLLNQIKELLPEAQATKQPTTINYLSYKTIYGDEEALREIIKQASNNVSTYCDWWDEYIGFLAIGQEEYSAENFIQKINEGYPIRTLNSLGLNPLTGCIGMSLHATSPQSKEEFLTIINFLLKNYPILAQERSAITGKNALHFAVKIRNTDLYNKLKDTYNVPILSDFSKQLPHHQLTSSRIPEYTFFRNIELIEIPHEIITNENAIIQHITDNQATDINRFTINDEPLLFFAINKFGYGKLTRFLLNADLFPLICINMRDKNGEPILHHAAHAIGKNHNQPNPLALFERLLQRGATPGLNKFNQMASDILSEEYNLTELQQKARSFEEKYHPNDFMHTINNQNRRRETQNRTRN